MTPQVFIVLSNYLMTYICMIKQYTHTQANVHEPSLVESENMFGALPKETKID